MQTIRVISNKRLVDFAALHPKAAGPLKAWRKVVESSRFDHFAALKATFNAVDRSARILSSTSLPIASD